MQCRRMGRRRWTKVEIHLMTDGILPGKPALRDSHGGCDGGKGFVPVPAVRLSCCRLPSAPWPTALTEATPLPLIATVYALITASTVAFQPVRQRPTNLQRLLGPSRMGLHLRSRSHPGEN